MPKSTNTSGSGFKLTENISNMPAKTWLRNLLCWFVLLQVAGCMSSNIKHYETTLPSNMTARLTPQSDKDIRARVDIFTLDKTCQEHYQGTIYIEKKPTAIALPPRELMVLSFHFLSSDWLQGKSSTVLSTLFTARPGYHYEAVMDYMDSAYEMDIFEIKKSTGKRKKLNMVSQVDHCQ